ncbi:ABC transporter substrate-binding protein [Microlunatus soli]|nr:ABC transporter substrate-binding protein [Microlunatus soli]
MTWNHRRGRAPLTEACSQTGIPIDWEARSLAEFEDTPITELAARYDLIAIDHPFAGQAEATGALVDLADVLPPEVLDEQRSGSVGPSFDSYRIAGHQWALPMDAAAQVSAWRPDLVAAAPTDWDQALDLLRDDHDWIAAMPANPTHLFSSFVSLCHDTADTSQRTSGPTGRPLWWADDGIDTAVGTEAARRLSELINLLDPSSLEMDPIALLDRMSGRQPTGDGRPIGYAPLVFGYSNYARADYGERLVRFSDAPGGTGTMIGGVGLAISAQCLDIDTAIRYVRHVVAPSFQSDGYARSGGQPGHRRAWTDPTVNKITNNFFADTLTTLDHSFLRGRDSRYPTFQRHGGAALHTMITTGTSPDQVITEINRIWLAR